ncbi:UDP-2,3-diacylglucosamine diphosphatase LpxI [Chloracidobacterium sp. E]|uniref:LpxI family protein n=2 Tax=Chloracidobacterium aggregatum TaxID=2851959 RepID=UPI001B8A9768|nr:UDP-2,3-diacylglucosamine diphosphatase LpxI [Chloracidobacterium aggregatum]QUV85711.1 UDP-2,3-diacylglucosamine diphosphatase LpxI [Chloracidobacterium sp. 2]QUV87885.1 UDP-2,3-diacylglucosamine diphosphatase LpxI [Chloracidobacterium sp. S]QUV90782.1 UDP-2,3-diacylglucosamine diphosphatase LpxI [Chloracidobacterium sp. A]QUV97190.1 UDP-2,3-diacylglucosamine diphosphatase LpxI [Chloracidobacterium sp. E]
MPVAAMSDALPDAPAPATSHTETYGLIAGNGQFPFYVLEGARAAGVRMVVAAIREETAPDIDRTGVKVEWCGLGQLGKMIRFFRREGVRRAIMAGQVKHRQIFSGALPDWRMATMLLKLARNNTDSLLGAVVAELAADGIELVDSTLFVPHLLAPAGVLTKRRPTARERADIDYGLEVAQVIAGLDLGQTIVVRNRAVVAVEAMEGTDAAILRAGELAHRRELTVVKVAKPQQDMRFDVPVIGRATIETMLTAGATALAVTAGKTLIFDRDAVIALANRHKLTILGIPPTPQPHDHTDS